MVPGMHVNTLSLLLLSSYAMVQNVLRAVCNFLGLDAALVPLLFAVLLTSAAVVHSFVDFVPSIFLGAPDESNVLSILPGHRLLLAGKGLEAVNCAAIGSLIGALIAILLVVPIEIIMRPPFGIDEVLMKTAPFILLGTSLLLILSEKNSRELRVVIDARKGPIERASSIRLAPPIPVDGEPVTISGRFLSCHRRRSTLRTAHGDWTVMHIGRPLEGLVLVHGTWRLRKRRWRNKLIAALLMLLSGVLGFIAMNAVPPLSNVFDGLDQNVLFPLLTGLFGVPTLLLSLTPRPVPPQELQAVDSDHVVPALKGAVAGFVAGWLPGITSTTGTVMGSMLSNDRTEERDEGSRRFISMVSSVGTSAAVFSLMALAVEGKGRTGAMLAVKEVLGEEGMAALSPFPSAPLSLLLLSVLVSSLVGYLVTLRVGRFMARRLSGMDLRALNLSLLIFILALILVFNGLPGLILAFCAALLGLLPPLLGVSRVHLTGCLLLPLILFFFGLKEPVVQWLGG